MPNKSVGLCKSCGTTKILARKDGDQCTSCLNNGLYPRKGKRPTRPKRPPPRGVSGTPFARAHFFRLITSKTTGGFVESENVVRIRKYLQAKEITPKNRTVVARENIPIGTVFHTENLYVGVRKYDKNFKPSIWAIMAEKTKSLKDAIEKVIPGKIENDDCIWVMPYHEPPQEDTAEVLFVINTKPQSKANTHMQKVCLSKDGIAPQVRIKTTKKIKAGTEVFADYELAKHEDEVAPRLQCAKGASGKQDQVTIIRIKRGRDAD